MRPPIVAVPTNDGGVDRAPVRGCLSVGHHEPLALGLSGLVTTSRLPLGSAETRMELNQQKEQFSLAYVYAVAAVAGFSTYRPSVDDDSIDLGIAARGGSGNLKSPRLEIQLKSTARDAGMGATVAFSLKRKNYDDLIADVLVPRILVVVTLPSDDCGDWLEHRPTDLVLRRCGFWLSLAGSAPSSNEATVTVNLPRTQHFSPNALTNIMARVGLGQAL